MILGLRVVTARDLFVYLAALPAVRCLKQNLRITRLSVRSGFAYRRVFTLARVNCLL